MPASGTALRLHEVGVVFNGKAALRGVNLDIAPGEAVALVGPSGSGKTTLLRLFHAAVRPTAGTVSLDGKAMRDHSTKSMRNLRSRIGFVHQDLSLVPNLRVAQNVLAGRLGDRGLWSSMKSMLWPSKQELARVHRILERVGIPEKIFQRTHELSGGQQQRVAIARALYQDPSVILADEPVSSVDPARAKDTVALLTRISKEEGITLCMSLHNLDLARESFQRLVGLRQGRLMFDCPTQDIKDSEFRSLYQLDQQEMLDDGC